MTLGTGSGVANAPERYVVGTETKAATEAAKQAAESVYRVLDFGRIGQAVAGVYPDGALAGLRRRSDVRYVELDGRYHAIEIDSSDSEVPWGVDRVDAEKVHDDGDTGKGADIAIIDTGIDDDHPDLQANVGEGKAFVKCRGPNCNYAWSDDHDHGTHCAGIADALDDEEGVVGVSTEATLHAVKVLDRNGSGSYSDVADGIRWTADQGYDVGSLSLGGDKSSVVKDACEYAYDKGVLLVAAAGNDGPCSDCVGYPAAYQECIAVSATSKDDSLANFSSTGPEVELAAPGENIYSTVIGGYDTFSGTSMACPHVSGAGGQLMADGDSNTTARDTLNSSAEDIGLSSNEQGSGLLDVEAALGGSSGGSNSSPSCTLVNPSDGDTVSGTVTVQVDASDEEDDDTNLTVEVSIDDGTWQTASYNATSGYYEYDWDTTGVSDGDHTVQARTTDSNGATTKSSQITVTVDNDAGDNAPAIENFALTNDSNPAWTRYYVDWSVSDADADLAEVTSEMLDSSGSVLASESNAVSGSSASGTDYLETKASASEIRLTVTDANGNATSKTKSI